MLYHHNVIHCQSKEQIMVSIHFAKYNIKMCYDTNTDIYLALLQKHLMPTGPGLPNSAAMFFSRPGRGLLPDKAGHHINQQ